MSQPLALLVDDELPIVRVCMRILLQGGLVATTANSVAEALAQVHGQRFDLLICDIRLPDGSGMDVIREFMRRQPGRPVIVITGSPEDDGEEQAERLGVWAYLHKPFEIDSFMRTVQAALSANGGAASRE